MSSFLGRPEKTTHKPEVALMKSPSDPISVGYVLAAYGESPQQGPLFPPNSRCTAGETA